MCKTPANCHYQKDINQLIDMIETQEKKLQNIINHLNKLTEQSVQNKDELTQIYKKVNQMEKKQPCQTTQ